jgi:hypothetical protein
LGNEQVKPWIEICKGFWVRDYIEFRAFWNRVHKQIWEKQQIEKDKIRDSKA